MPEQGNPCTVEQLAEYICWRADPDCPEGHCPHAVECAAQPVGDSWCIKAVRERANYNGARRDMMGTLPTSPRPTVTASLFSEAQT